MRERENIINFDFQGWPEYQMSIRDILHNLGFEIISVEGNDYLRINNNNPVLDLYPTTYEDDGMGYGSHPKKIIEVGSRDGYINMFIDEVLPKEELDKKLNRNHDSNK